MYNDNKNKEEAQNFWISYADLMAGLLFVFILLVGAIVIKYVFIQTDLQTIRSDLEREKAALGLSEDALADKKKRLEAIKSKLNNVQQENFHLSFELSSAQEKLALLGQELNASKSSNALLQENIATQIAQIALDTTEIQKLKDLLFGYELREKELQSKNQQFEAKIKEDSYTITLQNSELAQLENSLLIQSKKHQLLVEELDIAKVKIKNLTGIRIKVVTALKEKLGENINIDPNSGAIQFSSNILFEQNSYILKENAKATLRKVLLKYIDILLVDPQIRKYIEQIVIEGHTNSDGSYLYNLELSQKRALEVMQFLYEQSPKNAALLREYISASGRSFAQTLKNTEGAEDKDASRRIEIKFRIKNEKSIQEIQDLFAK